MPSLQQLPLSPTTGPTDLVLVEQNNTTAVVTVQTLQSNLQGKLTLAQNTLLGRVSMLPGGPEPVAVGAGLVLSNGSLEPDPAVLAPLVSPALVGQPTAPTPAPTDSSNRIATTAYVRSLPIGNISGLDGSTVTVTTGTTASSLRSRFGQIADVVADFGADPTGLADATAAFQSAVQTGKPVWIPPGTYLLLNSLLIPAGGISLHGAGMGSSVIVYDDTRNPSPQPGITNAPFNVPVVTGNVHLHDFTIQGMRDSAPGFGQPLIYLARATNVTIAGVEVTKSRRTGIGLYDCADAVIRHCRIYQTNGDGIDAWNTPNIIIEGNRIYSTADDSIACHTNDTDTIATGVVRSGVLIANNLIQESNGIKVLGPKAVTITGNVLKRMMGYGITAYADTALQGDTPNFGLRITNNVIHDVFQRGDFAPGSNREQYYIAVGGASALAGTGASAPGRPNPATGVVTDLYGTGNGAWYVNDQIAPGVASPGSPGVVVSGNTLLRTLPPVTTYDQWGYGPLQVGAGGTWNGPVTEAMLATPGIELLPGLRSAIIADNLIGIRNAAFGIGVPTALPGGLSYTVKDFDYDGVTIARNAVTSFVWGGFFYPDAMGATHQRIRLLENEFDGDPDFMHPARLPGGCWANPNAPQGIYAPTLAGLYIARNHFRNVARPVTPNAGFVARGNVLHADPVTSGFSTTNRGVGELWPAGEDWGYVHESCDPTDAAYGTQKSLTSVTAATAPGSGAYVAGHFVRSAAPASQGSLLGLGWARATTGSSNVLGTDWLPAYAVSGSVAASSVLAGPTSGSALPAFRPLQAGDIGGLARVAASGSYGDLSGDASSASVRTQSGPNSVAAPIGIRLGGLIDAVADFGADNTGASDAYWPLRYAMLTAAANATGGTGPTTVWLAPGVYAVSNPLPFCSGTALAAHPNSAILQPLIPAAPPNGWTPLPVLGSAPPVQAVQVIGMRVVGITFDGRRDVVGTDNWTVVTANGCQDVVFERCRFQNVRGIAIGFNTSQLCGLRDCTFVGCNDYHPGGTTNDYREVVVFSSPPSPKDYGNFIAGCSFTQCGGDTVSIAYQHGFASTGNRMDRMDLGWLVHADASFYAGHYVNGCDGVLISGNSMFDVAGSALDIVESQNVTISGNTLSGSGSSGIVFAGCSNVSVVGNDISGNGRAASVGRTGYAAGLVIQADSQPTSNLSLVGNTITDPQSPQSVTGTLSAGQGHVTAVASTSALAPGMVVTGPGLPTFAAVAQNFTLAAGSTTLTNVANTTVIGVGAPIAGSGVPLGAVVTAIGPGSAITISAAALTSGIQYLTTGGPIWITSVDSPTQFTMNAAATANVTAASLACGGKTQQYAAAAVAGANVLGLFLDDSNYLLGNVLGDFQPPGPGAPSGTVYQAIGYSRARGVQPQNAVLAGPSSGGAGLPGYRALTIADLPSGYAGGLAPLASPAFTGTPSAPAFAAAGSANTLTVAGSVTGAAVTATATGTDVNVPVTVAAKGNSPINLQSFGGTQVQVGNNNAAPTNYLALFGNAAGQPAYVQARGGDLNVNLMLQSKGSGVVSLQTGNGTALTALDAGTSLSNSLRVTGGATGAPVLLAPFGDSNASVSLTAAGTGTVTLAAAGQTIAALGTLTVPTALTTDNSTKAANTGWVRSQGYVTSAALPAIPAASLLGGNGSALSGVAVGTNLVLSAGTLSVNGASFAPLTAPTFTGTASASAFAATGSANSVSLTGSSAGVAPLLGVAGTDTNIGLTVAAKNSAVINLQSYGGTQFQVANNNVLPVNYWCVFGSQSGQPLYAQARGSDPSIPLVLQSKGTAQVQLGTGNGTALLVGDPGSSMVNSLRVSGSATGQPVTVTAQGVDANITLALTPLGSGTVTVRNLAATGTFGAFGKTPVAGPLTLNGSRSSGAALTSVIAALVALGFATDSTTA